MRSSTSTVFLAALLGLPVQASAHLSLTAPPSRYGPDTLKTGPCGISGGERTQNITYVEPGATIEVRWEEYVDHPGHYRIAFDPDGDDDFVDPATMMELDSNEAVLLDGIADKSDGERDYTATVTLPDVPCDNCTLQVIQVMYDKPPYTTPGNDIYYQCADLVLKAGGGPDAGVDPGPDPAAVSDDAGCSVTRHTNGESWMALLLLAVCIRRLAPRRGSTI